MNCPKCGSPVENGAVFCTVCGTGLKEEPQQAQAAPPVFQSQPPVNNGFVPPAGAYYPAQPDPRNVPLSVGQFVGMAILCAIPVVNLIMLLVWAFSSSENLNRRNFAKAQLIMMAIGVVIGIVFTILFIAVGASLMSVASDQIQQFYTAVCGLFPW